MELKRSLRNSAGWLLATALFLSGRVRKARARSFQNDVITAIAFHNPNRKLFQNTVARLRRNGYVFLATDQLIKALNQEAPCPRGAVWISLDDGWKDNIKNILPIISRYNIPVTIFIYTGAVVDGAFWWRKVAQSGHLLPARYRDAGTIRKLPEATRRQLLSSLEKPEASFPREAMTVADVKSLAALPQVTIGAHTVTHPVLPNCTDEQIEDELTESKRQLEEWIDKPVTAFAYPNGSFSGRERHFLEKNGYELAVTTESKFGHTGDDRYLFPRNVVMDDGSVSENICHILGIWESLVKRLKKPF
jgi:peptidoglycan/xylan/chitin deacetylase (PgdA/CDA1 family)